jgi:hypothetical protein
LLFLVLSCFTVVVFFSFFVKDPTVAVAVAVTLPTLVELFSSCIVAVFHFFCKGPDGGGGGGSGRGGGGAGFYR